MSDSKSADKNRKADAKKTPPPSDAKAALPAQPADSKTADDARPVDEIESSEYRLAEIVKTLAGAFLKHRNAEPANGSGALSNDAILERMSADGYYRINATLKAGPTANRTGMVIFVIDDNGGYAQHLPKFKLLCSRLQFDPAAAAGTLAQVIFVVGPGFLGKQSLVTEAKKQAGANVYQGRVRFTVAPQHIFLFDITAHASSPRSIRILTSEEVEAIKSRERLLPSSLPNIRESDPAIIWCGAVAGQCVLVECESESTGLTRSPYFVVP